MTLFYEPSSLQFQKCFSTYSHKIYLNLHTKQKLSLIRRGIYFCHNIMSGMQIDRTVGILTRILNEYLTCDRLQHCRIFYFTYRKKNCN